jgi:predicted nucleotidyltransferase
MPDVHPSALPPPTGRVLDQLVRAARDVLGDELRAAVLFGSAAEGRMRPVSDVNLMFVLRDFVRESVDRLRQPLSVAQAAIRLRPMFLLEREIELAATAFAVKFADIAHRRRVLWGADPFASLSVPRAAILFRVRQVLLNSSLRLRDAYLLLSLHEEQLATVIAEAAAPLRSAAAALLELEGETAPAPKQALERVAAALPGDWAPILRHISEAREQVGLTAQDASETLFRLSELADRMRERADALT